MAQLGLGLGLGLGFERWRGAPTARACVTTPGLVGRWVGARVRARVRVRVRVRVRAGVRVSGVVAGNLYLKVLQKKTRTAHQPEVFAHNL